jgi:hypothetical protein
MAYLFKARTVEAENSRCLVMTHTEERVTYAVTSRNNSRSVASGVFCESAPRLLLLKYVVNTFLQQ